MVKKKKKLQKSKELEHHLIFTREMDTESGFLTHKVISNIGETGVIQQRILLLF